MPLNDLLPAVNALSRVEKLQLIQVVAQQLAAVQFGDDHTGLFIRGDNALLLRTMIQDLQRRLANHPDEMVHDRMDTFNRYAKIIEQDVKYCTM